jgi:hypothetical protein
MKDRTMKSDDSLWMGLTIWYMTVLALCATASPGEGLFGPLLQLLPSPVHTWLYVPTAAILAWLLSHSLESRRWTSRTSTVFSALGALLFAALLEWAQARQAGRTFVWNHLMWASLGILFTWMFRIMWPCSTIRFVPPAKVIPFRRTAGHLRKGSIQ